MSNRNRTWTPEEDLIVKALTAHQRAPAGTWLALAASLDRTETACRARSYILKGRAKTKAKTVAEAPAPAPAPAPRRLWFAKWRLH